MTVAPGRRPVTGPGLRPQVLADGDAHRDAGHVTTRHRRRAGSSAPRRTPRSWAAATCRTPRPAPVCDTRARLRIALADTVRPSHPGRQPRRHRSPRVADPPDGPDHRATCRRVPAARTARRRRHRGEELRLQQEVLGRVSGEGQLGEHDQVRAGPSRGVPGVQHAVEVVVDVADRGCQLGEGDAQGHGAPRRGTTGEGPVTVGLQAVGRRVATRPSVPESGETQHDRNIEGTKPKRLPTTMRLAAAVGNGRPGRVRPHRP